MNLSSRIGRNWISGWICAALFTLAFADLRAQTGSATVSAALQASSVEAGQSTQFQIKVTNGVPSRIPLLPEIDGLGISEPRVGRSEFDEIGTGFQLHRTLIITFTYRIDTTRPGPFVIPGQQIDVDGASLRTLPVTLTVLERGTARKGSAGLWLSADLTISKKSAYVGESIPIEFRSFFGLLMRFDPDPDPTLNGEGFSLQKFSRPVVDLQTVQGAQVHAASYLSTIAGAKIGHCSVGPVETQPAVQVPWSTRQIFTDPKDYQLLDESLPMVRAYYMPQKRVKVTSHTVEVEIKPLPPGKPVGFSGAIGEFKLEAEVEPRNGRAGDPITVRLRLGGRGNFDRVAAPVISDEHGLRTYPATSRFKADDEINLSGVKTFEQVVIADAARSTLPAYHFNYLNPETGKYVEIDTPPIPVEVIGGNVPTPVASATPSVVVPVATPTPSRPPRPPEDILYIRTDPGPARYRTDFLPPYRRPSFWIAQGGVAAALLGLTLLGGLRARARNQNARQRAQLRCRQVDLERALSREETGRGEFYSAAAQLARLKAAAVAGQPAGSLSVVEICHAGGLDAQTGDSLERIFQRHDELAYSGAEVAREPVPSEERRNVMAVLKSLEHF